jgi:hypothetical protein
MVGKGGATHREFGDPRVELHGSNGFQSSLRKIVVDQTRGHVAPAQTRQQHRVLGAEIRQAVSPNNVGLLTGKKATIILASGGDFSPGSPVEKYNQASGYLRQVLAWIANQGR